SPRLEGRPPRGRRVHRRANRSPQIAGPKRFWKVFWEAPRKTKEKKGPKGKRTSTPTGRTFQRRPLRSARAGPFWSPVILSPRRETHFSPTQCRKRCCVWVYLRTGSSFESDRILSINAKPWTR